MDPLSLSAGIIAVLQLTGTLLSHLNDMRNMTKDQNQLAVEASNIYSLLVSLRFRVEQSNAHDPWFTAIRNLGMKNGPLDQIRGALAHLVAKIEPSNGAKMLGKQLMWKFEKSEMRDILDKMERIKTLVGIALTDDLFSLSQAMKRELNAIGKEVSGMTDGITALHDGQQKIGEGVSDITFGVTALNVGQQEEERRQIENWLSPIDFRSRQQEILKGAQAGTRQWLFDSEKFRSWVDADRGTLWCPGIPGAGKTVTSSIVIDHLHSKYKKSNVAVTCLFCNYRDRAAQSAEIFMANLLKQVIQQRRTISAELRELFNEREQGRLTFAESANLLRGEISHFSKVFVVIDALDETSEHEDIRRLVLSELQNLPINLLVTSRYEKSIEQRLEKAERLEIRATPADVQTYVKARIPSERLLARHIQADPTLQETIVDRIVDKSQGMFLLARFHMDSLVTKTKRKDVRNALETLPPELDGSYDQTIERIEGQGKDYSKLARRVLLWVSNTSRPLSPVELQYAIAVQPGMTALDDEDLDDQDLMVSVCAGLVVLDAETNTLRFVHYTAQEYFDRKRESLFGDVHAHIATSCITYLSFTTFADAGSWIPANDPFGRDEEFRHHPLTHYAVSSWAHHARKTDHTLAVDTLLKFFNKPNNVIRAARLSDHLRRYSLSLAERLSGIQVAAMFGLRNATQRLLDSGSSADPRDGRGRTPLFLAAMTGEVDVVTLLIARDDVNINAQTDCPYSLTPLFVAAEGSHHQIMRVLLQGGADVNIRSWRGTALNCAVSSCNITSTELLLEAGADPDTRDEKGTPVIFDAAKVRLETDEMRPTAQFVKLLQKHGANLKVRDMSQRTILHVAAEECNLEAVQMLLAEGFDPDVVDDTGLTPLHKVLDCLPPPYSKSPKDREEFHARHSAIVHLLSKKESETVRHLGDTPLYTAIDNVVDSEEVMNGAYTACELSLGLREEVELPWILKLYPTLSSPDQKTAVAHVGVFELE